MFYLMEVLSTFVESFVAFYAVTQMSLPRVCERRKSRKCLISRRLSSDRQK